MTPPERRNLKLELTWVGKDHRRPLLEPRILLHDPTLSYHAPARVTEGDLFDNQLIFGDNLLALKALATDDRVRGKVKCIFIDPPYNTGSAFEHYDDGMEHSLWLGMMRERLELLRDLLSEDGSIWISIDDNEAHYLKVLCDEIFGRKNFVSNIVWQKRQSRENRASIGSSHDHILVYTIIGPQKWKDTRNRLSSNDSGYGNPDNDPRGPWRSIPFTAQGFRPNQMYPIVSPTGVILEPPRGRCWGATEPVFERYRLENRVYFPRGGNGRPRIKQYLGEEEGLAPMSWWGAGEVGDNEEAKREILNLYSDQEPFSTPKPERLIERIIHIATNPGDLVLDSFAGSGTTGAVAHKMGRRWIMVELGEHAHTHIIPRLRKVIDGTDQGGISAAVGWKGGGGFRYFRLAPSLLKQDRRGQYVINPQYNADMLAEACCKLQGFTYAPSQDQEFYWMHGRSTERDSIYVTTNYLSYAQLVEISEAVGPERTLLILTTAYDSAGETLENLTLKKIPQTLLRQCDWDRDDYSLNVANLPHARAGAEAAPEPVTAGPAPAGRGRKRGGAQVGPGLFDGSNGGGGA